MVKRRQFTVTRYNQRMAQRIARRAKLHEDGVAVAFTYNNLSTMLLFGVLEDIAQFVPVVGEYIEWGISLVAFWWHRIVIVTEDKVYIYRDLPFHYPSKQLAAYDRGPGLVSIGSLTPQSGFSQLIRRGQLNFHDGITCYHGIVWIRRAQYIEQEGNIPPGQ